MKIEFKIPKSQLCVRLYSSEHPHDPKNLELWNELVREILNSNVEHVLYDGLCRLR